jgi:hypothetical protein
MPKDVKPSVSIHILGASSTLLGLCFVLLSSIKLFGYAEKTLIDELAGAATMFFLASSISSYVSMRSVNRSVFYERIADIIFIVGLLFLSIISLMIVFGVAR